MYLSMKILKPLLVQNRVFFMGPGVSSVDKTGASYGDSTQVRFSLDLRLEPYTTFWAGSGRSLISMGAFSYTHSILPSSVTVGRYTSIALGLRVLGARHPLEWASKSPVFYNRQMMMATYEDDADQKPRYEQYNYQPGKITIGNDVWIGENVTLGHGVHISNGAVIASNSVVTRDVAPYEVVGGVPAKAIRSRFDGDTVSLLLESRWWEYSPSSLKRTDIRRPREFASQVIAMANADEIETYTPKILSGKQLATLVGS